MRTEKYFYHTRFARRIKQDVLTNMLLVASNSAIVSIVSVIYSGGPMPPELHYTTLGDTMTLVLSGQRRIQ